MDAGCKITTGQECTPMQPTDVEAAPRPDTTGPGTAYAAIPPYAASVSAPPGGIAHAAVPQGTVPHASIPHAAAPLTAHQIQPEMAPAQPWIVHVVDDDAAVCSSLKFALELDGFDVRTYAGYSELLAADLPRAGCLIVDYNLPGLNGLDLLGELSRRDVHLPSFLITSNPTANVRRRAQAQGVAIIEKPLLSNQLSEAVRASFTGTMPC